MSSKSGIGDDIDDDCKGDVDFDFFDSPRDADTPIKVTENANDNSDISKQNGRSRKYSRSSSTESETDSGSDSGHEQDSARTASVRSDTSSVIKIEARVPTVSDLRESLEVESNSGSDKSDNTKSKENGTVKSNENNSHASSVSSKITASSINSKGSRKPSNAWGDKNQSLTDTSSSGKKVAFADSNSNKSRKKSSRNRQHKDSYSDSESETDSERSYSSRSSGTYSRSGSQSGSESDSDVTDVSSLESPDISPVGSPRRKYRDQLSPRHSKHSGSNSKSSPRHKDGVHFRQNSAGNPSKVPELGNYGSHRERLLSQVTDSELDQDRLQLRLLMEAVLEMDQDLKERQERLKASRRVMGPPDQKSKSRKNFSFSNDQVHTIDRENNRLLKKIVNDYSSSKMKGEKTKKQKIQPPPVRRVAPAAVNRQKQQRVIEHENIAMLKRLQGIRPTKGMSRGEHLTNYYQQVSYGVPLAGTAGRKSRTPNPTNPYGSAISLGPKSRSMQSLRSTTSTSTIGNDDSKQRPRSAKSRADAKHFEPGTGRWSFKSESDMVF